MNKDGFMLTVGGCPVIFTSPGINIQSTSELPLTHADFEGFASEVALDSIAHGALNPKFGSWTEKLDLATGLLDVTSLSFRIEDILMDYLGTEKNIASYLFTRDNQESYSVDLFNYTEGSDEGSVRLLFNFSAVTPTNYFWSQGECFKVEEWPSSGKTLNFYKRGVFNTFKRNNHNEFFDINQNEYADLFFEYPGVSGQEVLLWRKYTKNNETIWHVIWRGVANRAPRSTSDGAAIEIQADSFPNHFNRSKFYHRQTVCKIIGYDSRRIAFNVQETNSADIPTGLDNTGWLYTTKNLFTSDQHFKLTDQIVYLHNNGVGKNQKAPLIRVIMDNIDFGEQLYGHFAITNGDDGTRASNTVEFSHYLANPTMTVRACYGRSLVLDGQQTNGGTTDSFFQPGAPENRRYRSYVDSPGDGAFNVFKDGLYSDFVVTDPKLVNNTIPQPYTIHHSASLENHTIFGRVHHAYICEFEPSFINEENIKINPNFEPSEINWQTPWSKELILLDGVFSKSFMNVRPDGQLVPYSTLGSLTGSVIMVRDVGEVHLPKESNRIHVFTEEKELKSSAFMLTNQAVAVGYGLLKNQFSENYYLGISSTEFFANHSLDGDDKLLLECRLDGMQTNSEVCTNLFAIENLVQGLSEIDSKFTFKKLNKKRTLNIAQSILIGKPTWEYSSDSYYSTYVLKSKHLPGKELVINNKDSLAKYGTGKTFTVDLDLVGPQYSYFADPSLVDFYMGRLISNVIRKPRFSSAPSYKVKFKIPIDYDFGLYAGYTTNGNAINAITVGKTLYLTDWILPNGLGGRGMQSAEIVVVSKTVNFQDGTIEIEGIKQPRNSSAIGISPCVKVSEISTYSITISTSNYLNLSGSLVGAEIPQNYAGSNLSSYGWLDDRGAKYFSTGQKVQLILRDSTTYSTLNLTVNQVVGLNITFLEPITTSPVDWPAQAALGNVDLRFADYETAIDSQLTWAYIGDGDDGLINNETQAQRIF